MEVNTEAWSVGKYAKRSAIIHLNSDAEALTARLQSGSITAANSDGATADLRITLDANRAAGVAVGMFLRVVVTTVATSVTASHFREIAAFNAAADVDIAVAVPDLTNVNINNVTHRATFEIFDKGFSPGSSNVNFPVTIPNYIGYPEHQRCLVQVLSMATVPKSTGDENFTQDGQTRPLIVGLELEGVAVQNVFTNNHGYDPVSFTSSSGMNTSNLIFIGHMQKLASSFMYSANRSITDDGVLISSPFGKRLRVRIKSMTTNDDLVLNSASGDDDEEAKNNPVHITLRLLFLDDDEVPDR